MELQKWKMFKYLDPNFLADVKRAYLVGITSSPPPQIDDEIEGGEQCLPWSGGLIVMKSGDVYFITYTTDVNRKIRIKLDQDLVPCVPVKIDKLRGKEIEEVQSGVQHIVVLTTDGRVFQWGEICSGEERQSSVFVPGFLTGNDMEKERIIQITCGEYHALAVTSEGQVYSWGNNEVGQLGIGCDVAERGPTKVSGLNGFDSKIMQIACGGWTCFALDTEGNVWSWGDMLYDGLGRETDPSLLIPLKMPVLQGIKRISAGDHHFLALSVKGELYFCGRHATEEAVLTPLKIAVPNDVALIAAIRGCSISAFKTNSGRVYYWGYAFGHHVFEPVATKYEHIIRLFASLDSPMMVGPVRCHVNQPMTEKLKLIFDDSETADITFVVGEQCIYAHKMVLKLRSDHFKRMFDNHWKEKEQNEMKITEFTYKGFRTFLFYLYTDRIEPTPQVTEDAIELLKLADYYGEEDLRLRCGAQIGLFFTIDSCSQIYSASVLYNSKVAKVLWDLR